MIGARIPALDAALKVTGKVGYTVDLTPPGVLQVAVLRSTEPHARIVRVDASAAAGMEGVVATLTGADFAALGVRPLFGPVFRDQQILAMDRVRYVGDPIAAVAAEDMSVALAALELIEVELEPLPAVFSVEDALAPDAPLLHAADGDRAPGYADIIVQGQAGNICNKFQLRKGRGLEGFDEAEHVFEHEFTTPSVQHVSMEPHVAVAEFRNGRLEVTTSSQTPYAVRDALAYMFDLPTSRVRIRIPAVGGGFGGKTYAKVEPLAAVMALKTGRPTKVVLDRESEFGINRKHASKIRLRTGVRADGTLVARHVEAYFNAGAYTDISPRLIKNGGYGAVGPYRIPHVHVDSYAVYTNLPSAGAYRGYGVAQGAWAYESQMDLIADTLGIDRVEIRRRNLLRSGDTFATGEKLSGLRFHDVLEDAVSLFDTPLADSAAAAVGGSRRLRRGRGCAIIIKSTITPSTSEATVKLDLDGSLQVKTSTVDMGQGAHTVLAQIAAETFASTTELVNIVGPDTDVTPYDTTTSSSRSTSSMGAAVRAAVLDVRERLLALAADQLEADVGDLVLRDGLVSVRGTPESGLSVGQILTGARRGSLVGDGEFITEGGLDPETGQGIASEHWHQGAVAAEVTVDEETGKVTIDRIRASLYAGTVINPVQALMQVQGSVSFGVSQALFEQLTNEDGYPTNTNLSEYALAGRHDLPPDLQISLMVDPEDDEVHGIGETALPPVAPAVANAVADAIGVRIHDLPLTTERVLDAIRRRDDGEDS